MSNLNNLTENNIIVGKILNVMTNANELRTPILLDY